MRILSDADVRAALPMAVAIESTRELLTARRAGELVSAPRDRLMVGATGLVWTPGGHGPSHIGGLRLYLTGVEQNDQLVAVWDTASGKLRGLAIGAFLGALRTGAIGGVAIDLMARADSTVLGVVGFGQQAWSQVEAARAVRPISRVQVYRRDRKALAEQVALAERTWQIPVWPARSAQAAVEGADVVILATGASTPVIEAGWLEAGTHVNALGPKYSGNQEIGLDLIERAGQIVSDFPDQYRREQDFMLQGTAHAERLGDLAEAMEGFWRAEGEVTCFLSHGLSGTEVWLVARALEEAERLGLGQSRG